MPVSIDIVPLSDCVEIFGEDDISSSFSLAGHVSISISSPSVMFRRQRSTARVLLKSLVITFEGQSEVITSDIGYAPLRLCSITRELLNGQPVDLSNEGHEDSDKPCSWNVIFDIPVPGWLPTTATYGDQDEVGTSYALYATATFVYLDDDRSSIFKSLCSFFPCRTHIIDASRHPIIITRFAEVPFAPSSSSSTSVFPMASFFIDAQPAQDVSDRDAKAIPIEVLNKIQVVASIPSAVTMDEISFPVTLRLRASELSDSQRERLRIIDFIIEVEQIETYRSTPSRECIARSLVPPEVRQPPSVPLRNAHSVHALYDVGLLTPHPSKSSSIRSFSLLEPTNSGKYIISGDGRVFVHDCLDGDVSTCSPSENWYVLETRVPLAQEPHQRDWARPHSRRISENSPLFGVHHKMHIVLRCAYGHPDGELEYERLHFSLPMRHVQVPFAVPSPAADNSRSTEGGVELPKSAQYSQSLPAYSQLFHSNGERKSDYLIPLPLYERRSP